MKKVIISVSGGVADIEENKDNCTIVIIDHDNIEAGDKMPRLTGNEDIVVEVYGGVANFSKVKEDINAEIVDYDNEEDQ